MLKKATNSRFGAVLALYGHIGLAVPLRWDKRTPRVHFYWLTPFVWIRYLIVVPRLQITRPPIVSRKRWSALSLRIGNTYRNVNIRSLAHDFCRPNGRFRCQSPRRSMIVIIHLSPCSKSPKIFYPEPKVARITHHDFQAFPWPSFGS
jgi:hypothetical protein